MVGSKRIGIVLAAALAVGVMMPRTALAAPDAWITAKSKMALLTAEGVGAAGDINVDTVDGHVTLHGMVKSDAEKSRAASVVRDIEGAKGVTNLLQVVPVAVRDEVARSDDEIRADVKKALAEDAALKSSSINVQSVNDGVVLLAGTAPTLSAHLRALQTARAVPDVRRVASEIESPGRLSAAELGAEAEAEAEDAAEEAEDAADAAGNAAGNAADATARAAKDAGAAIADGAVAAKEKTRELGSATAEAARDMWITSATKVKLLADERTPGLDINVDTHHRVVTLFGKVASEEAKRAAEEHARAVDGVEDVRNKLEVVPPTS